MKRIVFTTIILFAICSPLLAKGAGFQGDANDKGPSDWSDWTIQKDPDGNVTGFRENDFEQKDTDGDGKISDTERKNWNDKKAKEDKERGGPSGNNWNNPDWDKDGDGKPDPGFSLDCYQCQQPSPKPATPGKAACLGGQFGVCGKTLCPQGQVCQEYNDGDITCHACRKQDFCSSNGYWIDAKCGGQCPRGQCAQVDVSKNNGKMVSDSQTREKGSTEKCYVCMIKIEISYQVLIVETPYERFVLGGDKKSGGFMPSSFMALAKVDKATGMIQNVQGQLKPVVDFMGAFNIGSGLMGLPSTGTISMDQLSSLLSSKLAGGGNYGAGCFDNVLEEADAQAASQGTPTSQDMAGTGKDRKKDKKKAESEILSEDQIRKTEQAGSPAVSGPVLACGEENGNKVLKIYDSGGALVDTITKAMLKANPGIITEKLGVAQQFTDRLIAQSGFDFASYVEKFTGIPLKKMQVVASQVAAAKSQVDQVVGKAAAAKKNKNKSDKKEEAPVVPNDPLYLSVDKHKSAGFSLGFLSAELPINIGPAEQRTAVKDQWGIRQVGYLPESDSNSAWNVMNATEKNVVIAVVDSGLDMTHPDGPQFIWTNPKEIPDNGIDDDNDGFVDDVHGWNFVDENHDFTDYRGHGTFVAGIIAAKYNNGIGIAGIDPGAVIMPIKVTDDEGQTDNLAIYRGINYAVDHGARIINVSLGGRVISRLEQQAIERANAMGVLVVVAAGNSNVNLMEFGPSSSRYALSVGMVDMGGARSVVSSHGANMGLLAPGEQIYSLCSKDTKDVLPSIRKAGYYKMDGTSFSAPMVTGTAALILAKDPQLTNHQVMDTILATATRMGEGDWNGISGAGLLNAAAALRADVGNQLILMITNLRVNRDAYDKVISVDVFGTVSGKFKEFTVELGRGKDARKFVKAVGPFQQQVRSQLLARLNVREMMYAANEWTIRLRAIDDLGKEHFASVVLKLPDK